MEYLSLEPHGFNTDSCVPDLKNSSTPWIQGLYVYDFQSAADIYAITHTLRFPWSTGLTPSTAWIYMERGFQHHGLHLLPSGKRGKEIIYLFSSYIIIIAQTLGFVYKLFHFKGEILLSPLFAFCIV